MPVVLMKRPSAFPRSTTFVSPVTSGTPAAAAAAAMARTTRSSTSSGKSLLQHEPGGEIERTGTHHGEVVEACRGPPASRCCRRGTPADSRRRYRSTSRSRASPSDTTAASPSWPQHGIAEMRQEALAQQAALELAAGAVAQQHPIGDRAAALGQTRHRRREATRSCQTSAGCCAGTGRSCSRPRRRLQTTPSARPADARACSGFRRRDTGAA